MGAPDAEPERVILDAPMYAGQIPYATAEAAQRNHARFLEPHALGTGIAFTASGPNSEGVTTELLVQKLKNHRCSPGPRYKSIAFHKFTEEGLEYHLPVDPGAYACAYRFTRVATGQVDAMYTLKPLIVGE